MTEKNYIETFKYRMAEENGKAVFTPIICLESRIVCGTMIFFVKLRCIMVEFLSDAFPPGAVLNTTLALRATILALLSQTTATSTTLHCPCFLLVDHASMWVWVLRGEC